MSRDEEKVRAAWDLVEWRGDYDHGTYLNVGFKLFDVKNNVGNPELYLTPEHYTVIWSAAAAYTDTVIEEARQMREEIRWIMQASYAGDEVFSQTWGYIASDNCDRTIRHCRASRVLARLQALYEQHVRGLKSEALR